MSEMPNPFKDFDPTKLFKDFDPSKMFDMSKLASEFKLNGMPGVDVQQVVAAQKRNVEALTAANQLAAESFQALAKRQTEIMRQTVEATTAAMRDLIGQGSPEEKAARQTEFAKEAFERGIAHSRELAEMMQRAQGEALDVINKRVAESLEELKGMIRKRA
jgi:phasin family protein